MLPKVSIVIPIYNAEKYMNKCIDSVLNQTLKDIEVILVNDGSTDGSYKVIDYYKNKDLRIKVIHQDNMGPSVARNNGIKIASGKYIGFVDCDDYIEVDMYEKLFNMANDNDIQMSMCGYKELYFYNNTSMEVKSNLINNKIYLKKEIFKEIVSTFCRSENYGFYSLWNKIYLREWLIDTGIKLDVNREHGEDWLFNINIILVLDSFICTNEILYNYVHINTNSLMFKYRENQFDLFLDSRKKLLSVMPEEFIDYKDLNTRFIYEFSSYILRTFKEIKDKQKSNDIVKRVLLNEEVIKSCKDKNRMSNKYEIITFFIRRANYKITSKLYKLAIYIG